LAERKSTLAELKFFNSWSVPFLPFISSLTGEEGEEKKAKGGEEASTLQVWNCPIFPLSHTKKGIN
jgi:hypothetical protein